MGIRLFLLWMVTECLNIPLSAPSHSIILVRSSIVMLADRALETLPFRSFKQFLMVKSSSHSAYNLTFAIVAWWMPVLESSNNPGLERKKPGSLVIDCLACTHSP